MNDYVIILNMNTKPSDGQWRILCNNMPVRQNKSAKPLAFTSRDEAAQWIRQKQQEGKHP